MTVLKWDEVGSRVYQTGIDRGVLYPDGEDPVAWNGLTGLDEETTSELKSRYMDGIKFLETVSPGDFVGKLKAFTYPDIFDSLVGVVPIALGLSFHEQPHRSFNLCYRTRVGNDLEGEDHGYKLHLLYNLQAIPDSHSYETIKNPAAPIEFSWSLTGTPEIITEHRPTVHISIDTRTAPPDLIQDLEDILYGTDETDPRFPEINEVKLMFTEYNQLDIIDNGDGTWTAIDWSDRYITMIDATTFEMSDVNANYLDPDTYQLSDTP